MKNYKVISITRYDNHPQEVYHIKNAILKLEKNSLVFYAENTVCDSFPAYTL